MSTRKNIPAELKISILRRHLIEGVPVSDLADEHDIPPASYYQWQRQLFEKGTALFERAGNKANERRKQAALEKKVEQLEEKIQRKNEVVAELLEDHVRLKKELGDG